MGKVLNAMKKSAGARRTPTTPATPAPPATPATPATPPVKTVETADNARTATATISKTVKTNTQTPSAITAAMSAAALTEKTTTPSLDAVSAAVQQATQKAVEKLSPDLRKEYTPPQVKNLVVAPSKKDATATPEAKTSDAVIKAVAAGQTVIRPKKTFKTSITPVVEESTAAEQTARPVKTNKPAIPDIASLLTEKPISPAKPAAPAAPATTHATHATHRPVSRAVSRADTLAAVRAKNGPVASRQSHYFSPLVVTHNKPRCQISEQFRHIRTALIRLANRGPVRCMITSSQPREGKTVTAVNMAYCFSEVTKKRTLLIDADLRRGRVSDLLGMGRKNGLSELLNGECTIEEATWSAGRPNFHVITAGAGSIEQIGEMLSGEQAEHVMTNLSRMYDNIIIDSPPVISVADPAILCRWVDMALMAVRIHSTHCNLIEQATQILEGVGVHVTGLIALDDKASQRNYYRYVNYG